MKKIKKTSNLNEINKFFNSNSYAIVGVSTKKDKFGNLIFKHFKDNYYTIYQIHKTAIQLNGDRCYKNLGELPEKPDALIICTAKENCIDIIKEAIDYEIKKIWLQKGCESVDAIKLCIDNNILVVYRRCIFMFTEPVKSIHNFHRWILNIFRKIK